MEMDVVFKLSQRLVIDTPNWAQDWAERLMASEMPVLGRSCGFHHWAIRTEAVGMKVLEWARPEILTHLTPRSVRWPVEMIIWDDIRDKLGGKMLEWSLLSYSRPQKAPGYLFREANTAAEYEELAARIGVTLPEPITTEASTNVSDYTIG